jgi:Na+-driven multidrug efflux pump
MASYFLRFSVIGAVAAHQSSLNLAVFNSSCRILWMCLVFSGSVASAICNQVGMALGGRRIKDAQYSIRVGLSMCIATLFGLSIVIVAISTEMAQLFSDDPLLWKQFHLIRWPLAFTMMTMNLSVVVERIVMNLGFTDLAFYAGLVGSWVEQVPFVVAFAYFLGNDMFWLYMGVACGYTLLSILLGYFLFTVDWNVVIQLAMERSESHPPSIPFEKALNEGAVLEK